MSAPPTAQTPITPDPEQVVITEGLADLAFREPRGWVVVDFKSDRSLNADRRRQYHQQVKTYAYMLAAAGEPVAEAWLLFTRTGDAEPVELPSLTHLEKT